MCQSLRIDADWSPVTSVDVMSGVFACAAVIDRCLMTPSLLKDGVTDSILVCLGQLGVICTKELLIDPYQLRALERGSGQIFLTVLI